MVTLGVTKTKKIEISFLLEFNFYLKIKNFVHRFEICFLPRATPGISASLQLYIYLMCHNIIVGFGSRFVVKISKNIDDKKLSNIFFIASRQDSFKKNMRQLFLMVIIFMIRETEFKEFQQRLKFKSRLKYSSYDD